MLCQASPRPVSKPLRTACALLLLGLIAVSSGCGSPVAGAAVQGDTAKAINLIKAGESPNATDRKGRTALELAIIKRHPGTAKALLSAGADPNLMGAYGWAPIHWAAIRGQREVAAALVAANADLNQLSRRTSAPALVEAVMANQPGMVQFLIDAGADLDQKEGRRHGGTALHVAIRLKRPNLARMLIEAGARTDIPNSRQVTARALALQLRQSDVVAMMEAPVSPRDLAARSAPRRSSSRSLSVDDRFIEALRSSDLGELNAILRDGFRVQSWSFQGRNALEWSIRYKEVRVVERLIQAGLPIGEPGYQGLTPLHWAAREGSAPITRLLINSGASMDGKNPEDGSTPLVEAIWMNEIAVAKLLIAAGADLNAVEKKRSGGTALHIAVRAPRPELVEPLLAAGASPSAKDRKGRTAFDEARRLGRDDWVVLMQKSAPQLSPQTYPVPTSAGGPPRPRADSLAGSIAGIDFGNYHALVVGNDKYANMPHLETAVSDAQAVARLLETGYGFDVTLLTNTTRSQMLSTLARMRRSLGTEDNLLLYYAGHGWFDERAGRGYWFPVDADKEDPSNWVSNVDVTDTLKAMDAKHIMIVADSCYSGTLTRGLKIPDRRRDYLRRMSSKRARVVMSSGGLEPVTDSGGGNHSVFASAFLGALEENTGVLDGTELFGRIRRPVMLGADQTPEYGDIRRAGHDGGDFLFVRNR